MSIIHTKDIKVYFGQSGSPWQFGNHRTFKVPEITPHTGGSPHSRVGRFLRRAPQSTRQFCIYSLLKSEMAVPYTHFSRRVHKCDKILTLVTKTKIDHLEHNGFGLPISSKNYYLAPLLSTGNGESALENWGVRGLLLPESLLPERSLLPSHRFALCQGLDDSYPGGGNWSRVHHSWVEDWGWLLLIFHSNMRYHSASHHCLYIHVMSIYNF